MHVSRSGSAPRERCADAFEQCSMLEKVKYLEAADMLSKQKEVRSLYPDPRDLD